jgi:hypothetical protein
MTAAQVATNFAKSDSLGSAWPPLSVSIAESENGQRHVGICVRNMRTTEVLHLARHNQLTKERLDPEAWFGCMKTQLPEARQRQVIARASLVYDSNGRFIPYGFTFPTGAFDGETGKSVMGPSGKGLTCATFVLAVFEFAGIRLVAYDDWPVRAEDEAWRQHILDLLARSGSERTKEHAAAIRADATAVRFRPEEVTAAAGLFPPVVGFSSAVNVGRQICRTLEND